MTQRGGSQRGVFQSTSFNLSEREPAACWPQCQTYIAIAPRQFELDNGTGGGRIEAL